MIQGMDIVEFLLGVTLGGGEWVLYLLLLASVLSVAVMIERFVFFRKHEVEPGPFLNQLNGFLQKDDLEGASSWLNGQPSSEARVIFAGLAQADSSAESAEEAMIGIQLQERFRLEKNLAVLGTLGNNAPFIGLFGTVLGIIVAFNDLASAAGVGGPSVVMRGISEALVATAVGLFVAIPAVIAYNYFGRRVKRVVANMDTYSRMLLVHLKGGNKAKGGDNGRAPI
jgi:biopolymer transport protein ExbB/TolQ